MTPQRVEFDVQGLKVVGHIFIPKAVTTPHPALVFMGPLTSVKEQVCGLYAQMLAQHGFVTLSIDHRHFGESEGEPREYEHPGRKVEDIAHAISYLSHRKDVDASKIGAVGVCAGAGYLSNLIAIDPRIISWSTVAGFFHDVEEQKRWMGGEEAWKEAIELGRLARQKWESGEQAESIPAVGPAGQEVAMPLADAYSYYGTSRGAVDNYRNNFARMSREITLNWDAQSCASNIQIPTLMIHSENALSPSLARKFFDSLSGPKEEVWLESKFHTDFYDNPEHTSNACNLIAEHFKKTLT